MAVMIPAILPNSAPPGEREVFARLRDDPATADWTVLHSLDIAKHPTQVAGEADFVIIVPQHGVLVAEVKSHSHIHRGEDGIWYYGHNTAGEARGPFRQAADAMHALRAVLKERCPDLAGVLFWSCAILPYASGRIVSGEWHPWQLIDAARFRSQPLPRLVESVIAQAKILLTERQPGWRWNPASPTREDVRRIVATLRPRFDAIQSPTARTKNIQEELRHYTEEQAEVLDALGINPRLVVHGPAGTGKTLLAVEAARRGTAIDKRTGLLCFNRLLSNRLVESTKQLPGLKCASLHKLMLEVANATPPPDTTPGWWSESLPELAVTALVNRGDGPLFDELVLDEVQDLLRPSYLDFLDLILAGGLAAGRWRAFGDFERQAIYSDNGSLTLDQFQAERSGNATFCRLSVNCRNLPRVARHVETLGRLTPAYKRVRRGDDGIDPEFFFHHTDDEQEANIRRLLLRLESEGYARHDVVLLSPLRNGAAHRLGTREGKSATILPYPSARPDCVQYTTIHSFKGLEAGVIVLTDINDVSSPDANDLFYVGISRSVHRLAVCASHSVALQLLALLRP